MTRRTFGKNGMRMVGPRIYCWYLSSLRPPVGDVFEMKMIVPWWGEEGVVVSRGYDLPLLLF
eukprot:scaffold10020_cov122-Isochrysis_galbana.AAC.5